MGKPQRRFGKEFEAEAVRLVEVSGRTQGDRHGPRRRPFDAATLASTSAVSTRSRRAARTAGGQAGLAPAVGGARMRSCGRNARS